MKRILIIAVLAAQIMTACGRGSSSNQASGNEQKADSQEQVANNEPEKDSTWYVNKMEELSAAEEKLVDEYKKLSSGKMTENSEKRIKEIFAEDDSISNMQKDLVLEVVRKYKSTKFPARFLAGEIAYYFNYDELEEVCDPKSGYYNEPEMKVAKRLMASLEKRHPGLQYKDLEMADMSGKTVKLSNWAEKGKYVLVDFWASWCGPCRQEMPNVVEAYNKYKNNNFEIVGVSFDNNESSWLAAVKQLGMTWPQMSDLKGWHSAAASVYGINSIPANVLLDPQGKIIAIDLRGEQLQTELANVLKK